MKFKPLAIGVDNFKKIISEKYYYVDKSLLIKEILDNKAEVTLFTRPRRFGKSLNLSMLKYYFEKAYTATVSSENLFQGLKIMKAGEEYLTQKGKYPVIMLNFKEMKRNNFQSAYYKARECIGNEFKRHERILELGMFDEAEKEMYKKIQHQVDDIDLCMSSMRFLCKCLEKAYGERVVLLIDEYDVPLENAHFEGFYKEMIDFVRGMLAEALKTNDSLAFAVLTGCLRISKESIFTGLNNLRIVSIEDKIYGEYFGFTNEEVYEMLGYYSKESHMNQIKEWYNGYLFGSTEVYNPWSLINHVVDILAYDQEMPKPYWSNTSSNSIIKELIEKEMGETREELERLVQGGTIEKSIHEDITYEDIYTSNENLWNFLYFTGYLKKVSQRVENREAILTMTIPNEEIKYIYERHIMEWVRVKIEQQDLTALYEAILAGDTGVMEAEINQALLETISYYDYTESYYHGFIVGMLRGMKGYRVHSNMELGLGRPDLVLEPVNINNKAIIFELKATKEGAKFKTTSDTAVSQIREMQYEEGFHALGYENTIAYGMGFFKKNCRVAKS